MNARQFVLLFAFLSAVTGPVQADPYHVSPDGNDSWNGLSWDTAFLTITNAVAQAGDGDTILVTNGTYTLNTALDVEMPDYVRFGVGIVITNGITLQSVNGAEVTTIDADQPSATADRFRIFYISHADAVVDGFTITNGYLAGVGNQSRGAGVFIDETGTVRNSIISGNEIQYNAYGAGAYLRHGGLLEDCRIVGNSLPSQFSGAGVYLEGGTVNRCIIAENTILRCTGTANGGTGVFMDGGILRNSLIHNNSGNTDNPEGTTFLGGGVYAKGGALIENCTIIGNYGPDGGGLYNNGATVRNCIIYFNRAITGSDNILNAGVTWHYEHTCTTPAVDGDGNITEPPEFADVAAGDFRLLPGSPCIDAGLNQGWMDTATDLGGNDRILNTIVDIGAYEYAIGALDCSPNGDPVTGFMANEVVFTAGVAGTNTAGLYYMWDFNNNGIFDKEGSDMEVATNLYMPGLYSVRLVVTNAAAEISERIRSDYIKVGPEIAYVATDSTPEYPYTSWGTAAASIHDAVNAGVDGTLVLVSNGVYGITNQIILDQGITVRSINGAEETIVERTGDGRTRIFYLNHPDAVLDGFTVRNGRLLGGLNNLTGGGILIDYFGTVINCVITSNSIPQNSYGAGIALNQGGLVRNCLIVNNTLNRWGGGVSLHSGGVVENCIIASNITTHAGSGGGVAMIDGGLLRNCLVYHNSHSGSLAHTAGGVYRGAGATIENCTIIFNYADEGTGGIWSEGAGTVLNSIIYFNTSGDVEAAPNHASGGVGWIYSHTCTTPAVDGEGNVSGDPNFKNVAEGNYRPGRGSPCINTGLNQAWMADAVDLDGNPRLSAGRVDMGAYESPPNMTIFKFY